MFKLLILDVDGVLTLIKTYDINGSISKTFEIELYCDKAVYLLVFKLSFFLASAVNSAVANNRGIPFFIVGGFRTA